MFTKNAHHRIGKLHEVAACIAQKRGRPSNAEKAQKAAQRAAIAPAVAETSENIAAAALQKLGNSTTLVPSPYGQSQQIISNAAKPSEVTKALIALLSRAGPLYDIFLQNDGGKELPERQKECLPFLAGNQTLNDALDEAKTKEIFLLAQKLTVLEGTRKKSLSLELEQDQKEKERLQKKGEELEMKYQKHKEEFDKIVNEQEELKKELELVDARANKRKALDMHQEDKIIKIRATATTAGAIMSELKRQLQSTISAPE